MEETLDGQYVTDQDFKQLSQLSHLGYVWQAKHSEGWYGYEPGIPSLMSFVHRNSLAQTKGKSASPANRAPRRH